MKYRVTRIQGIFGIKEIVEQGIVDPENAIFLASEYNMMDRNGGNYTAEPEDVEPTMFINGNGQLITPEVS